MAQKPLVVPCPTEPPADEFDEAGLALRREFDSLLQGRRIGKKRHHKLCTLTLDLLEAAAAVEMRQLTRPREN